jgi:hypothetical protein
MNESGQRVKFTLNRVAAPDTRLPAEWTLLAKALKELQVLGYFSAMGDGRTTGNIAMKLGEDLIVSRSGRSGILFEAADFVKVTQFHCPTWQATYESSDENCMPSSDTPLYWTALMDVPYKMKWGMKPGFAIHGHSLYIDEIAENFGIPISPEETEFSTPEDRESFVKLLQDYPYPDNKTYIRRGHGFFILSQDISEIVSLTQDLFQKESQIKSGLRKTI